MTRFCPFCSAENTAENAHCAACSRKLPPVPPRRKSRSTGPSAELKARAAAAREASEEAGLQNAAPIIEKKSQRAASASVRLPPVPARGARDLEAALRRPTAGDGVAETVTAPSSGPAAIPKPIIGSVSGGALPVRPATPPLNKGDPTQPALRQSRPARPELVIAPVTEVRDETAARLAPPAEPAPPAPAVIAPIEPEQGDDAAPRRRGDPSEPQLLGPRAPAAADDWPAPKGHVAGSSNRDSSENDWPAADSSAPFSTPKTNTSVAELTAKAPQIDPVPEAPDGGLWAPVRYLIHFIRGRWQRRSAIKSLRSQIAGDTTSLDVELGLLGGEVRRLGLDNRGLEAENRAIDDAEQRKLLATHDYDELQHRQAEENNRFAEIEGDRQSKVDESEQALETAKSELGSLEAQRRGLREKRKDVDKQQKNMIKSAEDREAEAEKLPMGPGRAALRRSAEELRRDTGERDPERQDIDRRLAALEKPSSKVMAKVEALKGDLESAKRSLNDAREGHRHRQSEIDAEKGRKSRELAQADAEIQRRLVTLGTLVNLNRIDRDEFVETYGRIDVLRNAIGSRSTQIERLTVERDAYDRKTLMRGALILAGGVVVLCLAIALLSWA